MMEEARRRQRCPCEPANTLELSMCSVSRLLVAENIGKEKGDEQHGITGF